MLAICQSEFSNFTRGLTSGSAKKYAFQKFLGGGGGKGYLDKSRFDWVFLNDGVPNQWLKMSYNQQLSLNQHL